MTSCLEEIHKDHSLSRGAGESLGRISPEGGWGLQRSLGQADKTNCVFCLLSNLCAKEESLQLCLFSYSWEERRTTGQRALSADPQSPSCLLSPDPLLPKTQFTK